MNEIILKKPVPKLLREVNVVITILARDINLFFKSPGMLIMSLAMPLVMMGMLGGSLSQNMAGGLAFNYNQYMLIGMLVNMLFMTTASGVSSLVEDHVTDFTHIPLFYCNRQDPWLLFWCNCRNAWNNNNRIPYGYFPDHRTIFIDTFDGSLHVFICRCFGYDRHRSYKKQQNGKYGGYAYHHAANVSFRCHYSNKQFKRYPICIIPYYADDLLS